jgi:hypothetical protein
VTLTFLKVYFGTRDDATRLLIRTRRGSEIHELIPHHILSGDLPRLLVENYTHWLNLSNGEMELRALDSPLEPSEQNWRMRFSSLGHCDMRRRPSTLMVDIRSPTFKMVSACLAPLESAEYLTMTYSLDGFRLSVDLPRFRLSFFLNSGGFLESHNWPGMVIDAYQSSGTMYGLSSQLVLRTEHFTPELSESRRVIIPHGEPRFSLQDHHVSICVDTTTASIVKYHEYKIDTNLGCLTGNTLESKLFKLWMHALSSHCLPDPLTGRTGTEEALRGFNSASCQSFQRLGATEADILRQVNCLTPKRVFYPPNKRVMQTVTWSDLPSLTQHYGFFKITQVIMKYSELLNLFYVPSEPMAGNSDLDETSSQSCAHLLERAARRNMMLYPEEFGDSLLLADADTVYASRDLSSQGESISDVSGMVYSWAFRLPTAHGLTDVFHQWCDISGPNTTFSLSYSRAWLELNLATKWISLYNLCRKSSRNRDRFPLLFSLSAMAYTCSAYDRNLLPTILAFATTSEFRRIHPPTWMSYDLSRGLEPREPKLRRIVLDFAVPFKDCPESNLPRNYGEDDTTLGRRRFTSFEARRDLQCTKIVQDLIVQWPCMNPVLPTSASDTRFKVQELMELITVYFQSWYQNRQLQHHIRDVQEILDQGYEPPTHCQVYKFIPCSSSRPSTASGITFAQLLVRMAPMMVRTPPRLPATRKKSMVSKKSASTEALQTLLWQFRHSSLSLHQLYGRDLEKSRQNLVKDTTSTPVHNVLTYSTEELIEHRDQCGEYFRNVLTDIRQSLSPSDTYELALFTAGQWPCTSTTSLLEKLAFTSRTDLTSSWRAALVTLAQGLLLFQRSQRLLRWAIIGNCEEFYRELENDWYNYEAWSSNPDWLLIQVNSLSNFDHSGANCRPSGGTQLPHTTHSITGCS